MSGEVGSIGASDTVLCESCEKNRVPKKAHLRCYACGKYTCTECAHYNAVYVKDLFTLRVRSMRTCPDCKIKL